MADATDALIDTIGAALKEKNFDAVNAGLKRLVVLDPLAAEALLPLVNLAAEEPS